jgi:hypothetical protein
MLRKYSYNQQKIRAFALILFGIYFCGGIITNTAHSFFHRHLPQSFGCECSENLDKHFHKTAENVNFNEKCPICQQENSFVLFICTSDYCFDVFDEKNQEQTAISKKYSTKFSLFSPRSPPFFA